MKKLLFACSIILLTTTVATAQDNAKEKAGPQLSKEKKEGLKKMKEEHIVASFNEIGFDESQTKQAREIIQAAQQKSNELKADNTIAEEDKKAKKDAINDEKNTKLKELLGDKYKQWQEIRKKQKAEEEEYVSKAS